MVAIGAGINALIHKLLPVGKSMLMPASKSVVENLLTMADALAGLQIPLYTSSSPGFVYSTSKGFWAINCLRS